MAYVSGGLRPGVNAPYVTGYYGNATDGSNGGNNDVYIPEIFSRKMLKDFYASTVFSDISNTDYEGEIKSGGDKVWIRVVPTLNIGEYKVGGSVRAGTAGDIQYEVPKDDARILRIDQAKYWAFQMDHVDFGQTDLPLINEFSANAAEQLKISVDAECLEYISDTTKIDSNNTGATAGAISSSYDMGVDTEGNSRIVNSTDNDADNIVNVIVEMNAVLDENNIPSEGRWVVLPATMCALLKQGDLRRADITGDSTGVIRNGLIGMVDNTKIYKSNQLQMGVAEEKAFLVPFGTNEAITFAAQITKTETGQLEKSFGKYWRGLFVYGREVIQPKAMGLAVLATVASAAA